MPKAGSSRRPEEEGAPHGAINEEEACLHRHKLEEIFNTMANRVKDGDESAMKQAIINCKIAIMTVMPSMDDADPTIVLAAVKDPSSLAICLHTDENQQKLEDMMPLTEIWSGEDVAVDIDNLEPLTEEQRRQISELFEDMELVHEQLVCACSSLAILFRTLTLCQLVVLLKSSIRPLVQLNAAPGLFEEAKFGWQGMELPEEQHRQVKLTMTPIATSGRLAKEKPNSVTRLLAAMVSFKILNRFADGTTQWEQQEAYRVRSKQLTLCITGRKYMGGRDKTTLKRKWKASGDDAEASSSKKATTE